MKNEYDAHRALRQFAIPKALTLTDRVCNHSHQQLRSNGWNTQVTPSNKPRGYDKRAY